MSFTICSVFTGMIILWMLKDFYTTLECPRFSVLTAKVHYKKTAWMVSYLRDATHWIFASFGMQIFPNLLRLILKLVQYKDEVHKLCTYCWYLQSSVASIKSWFTGCIYLSVIYYIIGNFKAIICKNHTNCIIYP